MGCDQRLAGAVADGIFILVHRVRLGLADQHDSAVLTQGRYTALVNDLRHRYAEFWGSVLKARGVKGLAEDLREFLAAWDMLREDQGEGLLYVMPTAVRLRSIYGSEPEVGESDLDDAQEGQQT